MIIDRDKLTEFAAQWLAERDYFLVDATLSPAGDAVVEIEAKEGPVSIDVCEQLTHAVFDTFDRDLEDYSLEVGSAGLTSPFKVQQQYVKAVGQEVEVLDAEGRKHRGVISDAGPDAFTLLETEKVKVEGKKRPEMQEVPHTFAYNDIKYTKYLI